MKIAQSGFLLDSSAASSRANANLLSFYFSHTLRSLLCFVVTLFSLISPLPEGPIIRELVAVLSSQGAVEDEKQS